LLAVLQGPGTRVTYRVRVMANGARELARGSVSGPAGTDLRFALRTDSADIEALFQIVPSGGAGGGGGGGPTGNGAPVLFKKPRGARPETP
jgi:hypothetical protein